MSNSHLFLKSRFLRSPLENGLGRYVPQLQRITIKFCKNHGSSKGVRDFIQHRLIDFSRDNPNVVVYVKPRRHRDPVLVGEYLNGQRHWMNIRNRTEEQVIKWIDLMRTQNEDSSAERLRKLWHTDFPSIQGAWTPYTHKDPALNLVVFPDDRLSKPLDVKQSATEKLIELFEKQKLEDEELSNKRGE